MCPHTSIYLAIYVSAYYYNSIYSASAAGSSAPLLSKGFWWLCTVYMCPHTTICVLMLLFVSSYYYICVLIRLHMCPHTTIYVSSYYYMCPNTIYVSNVSAGKPWRRCSQDDPYACIPYHCAANQEGTTECKILQNNPIQALVDMDVRCVRTTAYFLICVVDILLYVSSYALYHMLLYMCA